MTEGIRTRQTNEIIWQVATGDMPICIRTLKRVLQRDSVTCVSPGKQRSRYEHRIGEFTASSNRHLPSRHRMQPTCVSRGTNRLVAQGERIKPNIVDRQLILIQFLNSMLSLTSRFNYCIVGGNL